VGSGDRVAVRRREVLARGLRSPVYEAGPGDAGEAAVFVHGNPGSGRDFDDLVAGAGVFMRAVAPDMPGFAQADKPRGAPYTVDWYTDHLDALLAALGVRRAHLVLHDFGGLWGIEWALRHPESLASLTLINTGVLLRYRWHFLARIWRTPVLGELFQATATRRGFGLLVNRLNPQPLPEAFLDRVFAETDRGTDRAVRRLYRSVDRPDALARRQAAALRELRPPALVVWGVGDPYLPPALAERQREALPDARVVRIEGAGHWPFADRPAEVAAAVLPFLAQQAAAHRPGDRV
jgi:pimeloyl-ACP methyl ester carboxylesterase